MDKSVHMLGISNMETWGHQLQHELFTLRSQA